MVGRPGGSPDVPRAVGGRHVRARPQSPRLDRVRPRLSVGHPERVGRGGLRGLPGRRGRGARHVSGDRRLTPGRVGRELWRLHDQLAFGDERPVRGGGDEPLDHELGELVRRLRRAGPDGIRFLRHAVGAARALSPAVTDLVRRARDGADAHHSQRERLPGSSHGLSRTASRGCSWTGWSGSGRGSCTGSSRRTRARTRARGSHGGRTASAPPPRTAPRDGRPTPRGCGPCWPPPSGTRPGR